MSKNNTHVKIHAKIIESCARDQIKTMAESPALSGKIRIMPDVHLGKGSVIGFTGKFNGDLVIPNIIGVDIGCGVIAYPLNDIEINFKALDEHIRKNIPLGKNHRESPSKWLKMENKALLDAMVKLQANVLTQIGSLGGGNHFIEIAEDEHDGKWLLIHSGSRNFGHTIATKYQKQAVELCKSMKISVAKDLEYLPMKYGGTNYLNHMRLAQKMASMNRKIMLKHILDYFKLPFVTEQLIESVHNFIDDEDSIVRKGAISAYKGQEVVIPMNMAQGSIIGIGKGNEDYNYSAPHGAGRVFGRNVMKEKLRSGELTMEDFETSMEGIFSTSICPRNIDESKFAYKQFEDIEEHLKETVDIQYRLKPIYNLKA